MKRSNLFRSYLLCNLALVLLPVVIFAPLFYSSAYDQLKGEIVTMRRINLDQTARTIDSKLRSFGSMVLYASLDPDLTPYQLKKGDYSTITALRHLRLHSSPLDYEEIFLYIHKHEAFYGTSGSMTAATFREIYNLSGAWDWDDFYRLIDHPVNYSTSPPACYLTETAVRDDSHLLVIHPWLTSSQPYGAAIGLINIAFFEELLKNLSNDLNSTAYIFQGNQVLFAGTEGPDRLAVEQYLAKNIQNRESDSVRINGVNYLVTFSSSEVNSWQYMILIPRSSIISLLISEKTLVFFVLLLVVICCIVLGVVLAMFNYMPIHKIGELLLKSSARAMPANRHEELKQIEQHVVEIVHNNQSMTRELDESKEHVRQSMLYQLMCGNAKAADASYKEKLELLGIMLHGPGYRVVVVGFSDKLTTDVRNNILQSLQTAGFAAVEAMYKEYFAILLNSEQDKEKTCELIHQLQEQLSPYQDCGMSFGVGQVYNDLPALRQSFVEAVAAFESTSGKDIRFFETISSGSSTGLDWYPGKAQIRLAEAIRQGNELAVESAVRELEQLLGSLVISLDAFQLHFFISSILLQLLPVINDLGDSEIHERFNQLIRFTHVDDFISLLDELSVKLARTFNQERVSRQNQVFHAILAYIDEHYTEQDLSLSGIADQFDMTSSTLSRLFSDSTGMRFIDYLSHKRLMKASELLTKTKLSIRDIVEQIGYIDVSSFTRKFTAEYGQSPGRFRQNALRTT